MRAAYPAYELREPLGLPTPGRGISLAGRVAQPVYLHDRYRPAKGAVNGTHCQCDARTVRDRPLDVVDELAVHEGGVDTNDRQLLGYQSRQTEVLPMAHARIVMHGAGVAGKEDRLMAWQHGADVVEQVSTLRQATFTVVEARPSALARGPRDFLQADNLRAGAGQPFK